jgi:glycosyltransferase involved in cell wall biosynthesis
LAGSLGWQTARVSAAGEPNAIAVVIPAFNGALYVEEAIHSALDQTHPPAEVIVVDDGSTDATVARASRLADVDARVRVISQANAGVSAARNAGVRASTSDLVAFLDCDDIWYPDKLQRQFDHLRQHPGCVLVGSRLSYLGDAGRLRGMVGEWIPANRQDDIRAGKFLPMQLSSWLVRRDAFEAAGWFDEGLRDVGQVEDVDLIARLARIGEVHIVPGAPAGGYRLHGNSASSASFFRSRVAVRFVRARIEARAGGNELTFEEFQRANPDRPPSRSDRAQFAFREAGVEVARRRLLRAAARLIEAFVLDPRYAARRLRLRMARTSTQ